ncbi:MAG: peptide chain release factor N(5)-glutamine methyltransferase [Alkalispirochaeta sp.]
MPVPFPMDVTVGQLRTLVAESLTESDSASLDALILLETATARKRDDLLAEFRSPAAEVMNEAALATLASLTEERRRGVSIAYITGTKEFYGYDFCVGPGVLVPRPESEHLVEEGLRLLDTHRHAIIHDCCAGTGCVGIALARERTALGYTTDLVLSDIEPAALRWTARNAERLLGTIDQVRYTVERRNVLEPISRNPPEQDDAFRSAKWHDPTDRAALCDLITANPPYLTTTETRRTAAQGWTEPTSALDGGADGLRLYEDLAAQAFPRLRPERYVLVEHGWTQGAAVRALFVDAGFELVNTVTDLAGRDRLVRARRPADNS